MIKYITQKPKILFCGINPHPGSYQRGVPFSNNKMFWYLLSRAEVLKESSVELKDDKKLKNVYENKFNQHYNLGFINIIMRPTRTVRELIKEEELKGRTKITQIIKEEKPFVVCFVGKISYEKYIGSKQFEYGWQKDIYTSNIYVMHAPNRGEALVRIKELQEIQKKLSLN